MRPDILQLESLTCVLVFQNVYKKLNFQIKFQLQYLVGLAIGTAVYIKTLVPSWWPVNRCVSPSLRIVASL